jgi:pimeloyl-ACP methyl ester carboxylesterase
VQPARAVFLPGAVLPASAAYGPLVEALGADVEAVVKDLELYADDEPPADYGLDHELDGVLRETDRRGWERFHLVGYSGGGAVALAFVARYPERLLSLGLLEPAWAGNWEHGPAERAFWSTSGELESLSPDELMDAFARFQLKPGVEPPPPPPGESPPWLAKRPAGIRALIRAFETSELDRDALSRFSGPVYFARGGLSADSWKEMADRLSRVFPVFEVEVFDQRHHFDPPHRVEPDRIARALRALWARAETG